MECCILISGPREANIEEMKRLALKFSYGQSLHRSKY